MLGLKVLCRTVVPSRIAVNASFPGFPTLHVLLNEGFFFFGSLQTESGQEML